jgi:branched-chain amino acid transport system substrate-binding protein
MFRPQQEHGPNRACRRKARRNKRGGVSMRFVTRLAAGSVMALVTVPAMVLGVLAVLAPASSMAADMPGVTATEIKIGQTMPYSGPVSAFGALGKGEVAYFKMLNERGGINGRKVNLISLDDGYAPPKTVEQTRRLVESDEVALIFSSIGTAHNTAISKYLQGKNIPQLFVGSGASKFADPAQYPQATLGVQGPFRYEARLYARYVLAKNPDARFAVISQNDDFGRDYLLGLKDVLGDKYDSLVTAATYEVQDPTIDSQIVKLKASGADVLVIAATPKFAAQSIRKVFEIGWKPMTFLSNVAVWINTVMQPAGLDAGVGILSTAYIKDPDDPAWKDDADVKAWREFMTKYAPEGDLHDANYVNAYNSAMALEAVLKACGDDLSTGNILKQAYSIKDLALPMLLPGIRINTSATDHVPVDQMQFMRFNGKSWERFGQLQTGN